MSLKKLLRNNASILFFLYQTSQYTKNYLKAKIHCWKKESSIKFLWEAIRQLYEKKDQGSTGIKWCPSTLQLHLSINVDCRWRCNIMLGSLDYDKKCNFLNKYRIIMILKGAILTWATGPWDRLFLCPAPKFGVHFGLLLVITHNFY